MPRQEGDKNAKSYDSEQKISQPGHKLQWMWRPTPTIFPRILRGLRYSVLPLLVGHCLTRRLPADGHLGKKKGAVSYLFLSLA